MSREVIFRDRQELQSADLNNVQSFTTQVLDSLVADAVGPGLYFTGFDCLATNTWEVTAAAGRRYSAGQVYRRGQASVFDLFSVRPISQKKIVAIVSWGQTIETDIQPRDYLIDVETGATEPQSVAMERLRSAELQIIAGSEAAQPQVPQIPQNNVLVALVTIGTGGIEAIAMQEANRLPQIARNLVSIIDLIAWRAAAGTTIDRLKTDLFTLGNALRGYATLDQLAKVQQDQDATRLIADQALAQANEAADRLQLDYTDEFENDLGADTDAVGYAALLDGSLRFPVIEAPANSFAIALLNPNDPAVSLLDDIITPRSLPQVALDNSAEFAGSVGILAYSTSTQHVTYVTKRKNVLVTDGRQITKTYAVPVGIKPLDYVESTIMQAGLVYKLIKVTDVDVTPGNKFNVTAFTYKPVPYYHLTPYKEAVKTTVTEQIPAQGRAQTFITSSGGRLESIDLFFDSIGATGDVRVLIAKADGNNPDQSQVIAQATILVADLRTDGPVRAPLPPVSLEEGVRHSLHILSAGNHKLRLSNLSRAITQGEHFAYTGDNAYIRPSGEAERDIAFRLNYRRFETTKVEVNLMPVSLAGGMDGMIIEGDIDEPDGTNAYFQAQVAGVWQTLDIVGGQRVETDFSTRPQLVPMRLVFEGTLDKMPSAAIGGTFTEIRPFRKLDALKYISQEFAVASGDPVDRIRLTAILRSFNDDVENYAASLIVDGSPVAASEVTDVTFADGDISRTSGFDLAVPTTTYTVVIEGSSSDTDKFAVERLHQFVGVA